MVGIPWMLLERMILNMIWVMQTILLAYFPLQLQWNKNVYGPMKICALGKIFYHCLHLTIASFSLIIFPLLISHACLSHPFLLYLPPLTRCIIFHCRFSALVNKKTQEDEDDRVWKKLLPGIGEETVRCFHVSFRRRWWGAHNAHGNTVKESTVRNNKGTFGLSTWNSCRRSNFRFLPERFIWW